MSLSGEQRKQLQSAFIDAFPNTESLEQMLSFGLNINLRTIAGEGSLQDIVFKLIQTAEAQGWIEDLIRAACSKNPGNPNLQAIAQTLEPTSKIRHKDSFPQQPITNNIYKLPFNQLVKNKLITGGTILLIGLAGFGLYYSQKSNSLNAPFYYYSQGLAHKEKNEWDEAIKDFTEAINLKPNYPDAYYNRGLAHKEKNEWDEAIKDFTEAINLKSNYPDAYYNRGLAHKEKNEWDEAIKDFTEAINLKPNYPDAYYNRGLAHKGKNEWDEAIKDFTEAINLKPNYPDPNVYYNRGLAYRGKNEWDEAIKDFTEAINLKPNYPDAYYNRGLAYKDKGSKNEAVKDFNKTLTLTDNVFLKQKAIQRLQELDLTTK